jgi:serine-threonine kinase receptor-associated protein
MTAKAPNSATSDAAKVKICTGHTRPICHVNYSNIVTDTFWFVTSCHDAKPMIRNGETGDWVGTFDGHKGAVYCSSFNAAATHLVTGSGDYTAIVWDAVTGQKVHWWDHPHYIKSCDWLENKIVTGNYDSKVRIFDATNYSAEPFVIAAHEKPIVKAVYFVNDTNTLVTACESTILKWDLRSGKQTATKDITGLNVLEYTHQHNFVAAHAKSITFLDPMTLEERGLIAGTEDIECASLSPCGKLVAVGSRIKAKEFSLDGTELESHRGHHGPIFHIRWAPDGQTFSSGAEDGMVRMWPSHEVILKHSE